MIVRLTGRISEKNIEKELCRVLVDVNGVGYEVWMTLFSAQQLPDGMDSRVFIRESVTAFDGVTTLYGFATREEQDMFDRLRSHVDGMGPKKALESLSKIIKSLPDFKRAVIESDHRILVSVFGFTKKTAEKIVVALKDKLDGWSVSGSAKWTSLPQGSEEWQALSGLVNLGYTETEARDVLKRCREKLGDNAKMENYIQEALRILGSRLAG